MALIPFDDRDGWVWFDGKLTPWREARIHVLNHGLHYASCVFEGQRAYDGVVFKLNEHSERLARSAQLLGFELPYTPAEVNAATAELLAANGLSDAYVRPVAWLGSEQMGVYTRGSKVHMAIACWEWPSYFSPEEKLKGIRLEISRWKRPAPDTAPTESKAAGLYMICTMSRREADGRGFDDALMLDYRGYVAEATGANIFFGRGKELHTPTPDCFLDGITRRTVMGLAREAGYTIVERHIRPEEMAGFDECFLTGSAAEVTPVRQIGDYSFKPAEACSTLLHAYSDLVRVEGRAARAAAAAE
ncbi:MAG: branched-chain amino acid aminotransferase [Tistrella sp.]|uniref:Branched-chain-amino-acid aminotransferase n=2 Tax=Tistrella mobilis TaxID=171437 RepID=I3TVG1_TISMK|nr:MULTISPECIES: branched-chain amino acid aminotransferase [Tistrella]AFK56749.1 branched-chain amino acid aminotransferase [Tistrella mobilis KA081020-065]MAD40680.1 branched-chain amino acid aminotransferase [Tistrella sp.]MBA78845.1 branched-chain amino acid aminotransferase [Tistrella sp.]HAE49590.1 branched-chain amino acid aminotransferase [Tistrella mobilis]